MHENMLAIAARLSDEDLLERLKLLAARERHRRPLSGPGDAGGLRCFRGYHTRSGTAANDGPWLVRSAALDVGSIDLVRTELGRPTHRRGRDGDGEVVARPCATVRQDDP